MERNPPPVGYMSADSRGGRSDNARRRKRRARLVRSCVATAAAVLATGGILYLFQPSIYLVTVTRLTGQEPEMRIGERTVWMPKWFYVRKGITPEARQPYLIGGFYVPWRPWLGLNFIAIGGAPYKKSDVNFLGELASELTREVERACPNSIGSRVLPTGEGDITVVRGFKGRQLILHFMLPGDSLHIAFRGTPIALKVFSKFLRKNQLPEELVSILKDPWILEHSER